MPGTALRGNDRDSQDQEWLKTALSHPGRGGKGGGGEGEKGRVRLEAAYPESLVTCQLQLVHTGSRCNE